MIKSPIAISNVDVSPVLKARARGGSAEYVLPSCARTSSRVSILANVTSTKATHCTMKLNNVPVEVRSSDQRQLLGTIVAPLLSPEQVGLVLEDISPPSCTITEVRLMPIEGSAEMSVKVPPHAEELLKQLDSKRSSSELLDAAAAETAFTTTTPCWRARANKIWHACKHSHGRCAFATLVLNDRFGAYAYALYRSLKATGTTAPLVVMTTPDVSEATISTLLKLGGESNNVTEAAASPNAVPTRSVIRVHRIGRVQYPSRYRVTHEDNETRKSLRFTKLEAWRLTSYRKVVLIDTDTMVLRNIDALFTCAAGSAVADMGAPTNFNSGIFVLDPSEAVYAELRRLTSFLISYNQGDQGFLNKAFPEWRLRPERQLPEVFNYFLKWRNSNSWFSLAWAKGVHVLHFTDIVKPHNWFLHPSTTSFAMPSRLSFVGQQGDMFQSWMAMADEYRCAHGGWTTCNRTVLELRNEKCRTVVRHYSKPAEAPASFSVMISHAPFRNPQRLVVLVKIELSLQTIPELHTIFLIVHGDVPSSLKQSGKKPLVKISPQFDALGNRFGPITVPTDGVLIMDDDILLDPQDIRLAFRSWRHSPTQIVGTFMRAVTQKGNQFNYETRGFAIGAMGSRKYNIVLTKLMFVHRHYLFMYACLLPYQLWALPNTLLNCEDVLMNLMVGTASGLPPLPHLPIHAVQLDYGTPPPDDMLGVVLKQAGLSGKYGSGDSLWANTRSTCTNEIAAYFEGVAATTFSRWSAYQSTPPLIDIPFAKRWINSTSGNEVQDNHYTTAYQTLLDVVELELFKGQRLMDNETEPQMNGGIPQVFTSGTCPTREDVLNTMRVHRWLLWDDSSSNCSDGCRLRYCFEEKLAPCCVRRQTAIWNESCQFLPHGCHDPHSRKVQEKGAVVVDKGMHEVPHISPSTSCPSYEDVLNTPISYRQTIWEETSYACGSGCFLRRCSGGKWSPCCVKRLRAVFRLACPRLRRGCPLNGSADGYVVEDKGAFTTPIVETSTSCPSFEEVANTRKHDRERLWADSTPPFNTNNMSVQMHAAPTALRQMQTCQDGCAMKFCKFGKKGPCCVRRARVVQWGGNLTCKQLRYGCSTVARADTPWSIIYDFHVTPTLNKSFLCPTREMVFNTQKQHRWALWEDPGGTHDCKFLQCSMKAAPCNVKRLTVGYWPVHCDSLPFGCEQGSAPSPMRMGISIVKDLRVGAKFGSGPWFRAMANSLDWSGFILPSVMGIGMILGLIRFIGVGTIFGLIRLSYLRARLIVNRCGSPCQSEHPKGARSFAKPPWRSSIGRLLGWAFVLWAMIGAQLMIYRVFHVVW